MSTGSREADEAIRALVTRARYYQLIAILFGV